MKGYITILSTWRIWRVIFIYNLSSEKMIEHYAKRKYKSVSKKVFCKDCLYQNECKQSKQQINKCIKDADLYQRFCEIK